MEVEVERGIEAAHDGRHVQRVVLRSVGEVAQHGHGLPDGEILVGVRGVDEGGLHIIGGGRHVGERVHEHGGRGLGGGGLVLRGGGAGQQQQGEGQRLEHGEVSGAGGEGVFEWVSEEVGMQGMEAKCSCSCMMNAPRASRISHLASAMSHEP